MIGLPPRPETGPHQGDDHNAANPRVAVVIPVYNTAGAYVQESVTSALEQTIPTEIILVDDGSTRPETRRTIDEFAQRHDVRVLRHDTNRGVAAALNTGCFAASAPYLLTVGSDDRAEPTYAELASAMLDERPEVSIVTTDIQRFGAERTVDRATGAPNGVRDMLFRNVISGASVCRKSDFVAVGGYAPLRWGEDYELWLRILARGGVCVRLESIQYHYRIHEDQATQTLSAEEKLADRLKIVTRNPEIWAAHLDAVMTDYWRQEEALAYFKRRYGPLNDIKSRLVSIAGSAARWSRRKRPSGL